MTATIDRKLYKCIWFACLNDASGWFMRGFGEKTKSSVSKWRKRFYLYNFIIPCSQEKWAIKCRLIRNKYG